MKKVNKVREYLQKNKPSNVGDLFSHFKLDLDSIIIACAELHWDSKEFTEELFKRKYSEDDINERLVQYLDEPKLFKLLVPQTVQTAIIALINFNAEPESKSIVMVEKNKDYYLTEIDGNNLFDDSIIFFSTKIDLRNENYLNIVNQKVKDLDVIFQEPIHEEFFKHFELVPFLAPDEISQQQFVRLVKQYESEAIFPVVLTHRAILSKNKIFFVFDTEYLKESIFGLPNGPNLTRFRKHFIDTIKKELTDELAENAAKFALTQNFGLGALDIGVKAVKIFFNSLVETCEPLSQAQINKDYVLYQDSEHENVKDWFYERLNQEFKNSLRGSNLDDQDLDPAVLKIAYNKFITRYFVMAELSESSDLKKTETHTELFLRVYDQANNFKIRVDSGYF